MQSFSSTLKFCAYEYECSAVDPVLSSSRIWKLRSKAFRSIPKRLLKIAVKISRTRDMDRKLGNVVRKSCSIVLSIFEIQNVALLGFCFTLFYLRGRCSDLSSSNEDMVFDCTSGKGVGYLEMHTPCDCVKNLQTMDSYAGIVIFVGHALTMDGRWWAEHFEHAREFDSLNSALDECSARTILYDGLFAESMMSPSDVTQWLRVHLFEKGVPCDEWFRVFFTRFENCSKFYVC